MSTLITILGALVIVGFVIKSFIQKPSTKPHTSATSTSGGSGTSSSTTDDNTKFQI